MFSIIIEDKQIKTPNPLVFNENISDIIEGIEGELYEIDVNYRNHVRIVKNQLKKFSSLSNSKYKFLEEKKITNENCISFVSNVLEVVLETIIIDLVSDSNYNESLKYVRTLDDLLILDHSHITNFKTLLKDTKSLIEMYSNINELQIRPTLFYEILDEAISTAISDNRSNIKPFNPEQMIYDRVIEKLDVLIASDITETYNNIKSYSTQVYIEEIFGALRTLYSATKTFLIALMNVVTSLVAARYFDAGSGTWQRTNGLSTYIFYMTNTAIISLNYVYDLKLFSGIINLFKTKESLQATREIAGPAIANVQAQLVKIEELSNQIKTASPTDLSLLKQELLTQHNLLRTELLSLNNSQIKENADLLSFIVRQVDSRMKEFGDAQTQNLTDFIKKLDSQLTSLNIQREELEEQARSINLKAFFYNMNGNNPTLNVGNVMGLIAGLSVGTLFAFYLYHSVIKKNITYADYQKFKKLDSKLKLYIKTISYDSVIGTDIKAFHANLESDAANCRIRSKNVGSVTQEIECTMQYILTLYSLVLYYTLYYLKTDNVDVSKLTSVNNLYRYNGFATFKSLTALKNFKEIHDSILSFEPKLIDTIDKIFSSVQVTLSRNQNFNALIGSVPTRPI